MSYHTPEQLEKKLGVLDWELSMKASKLFGQNIAVEFHPADAILEYEGPAEILVEIIDMDAKKGNEVEAGMAALILSCAKTHSGDFEIALDPEMELCING